MPSQPDVGRITHVDLARSRWRLLLVPLVVIGAGAAATGLGLLLAATITLALGLALAVAGLIATLAAVELAATLATLRLQVETGAVRVRWLGGEVHYLLAEGPITRIVLRGKQAVRLHPRFGALGWALGTATLRERETIEIVRLAPTRSMILLPTDRGRLAIAPADEAALVEALTGAVRRQRLAAAVPPPEVAVRPPQRPLTGIERTLLEQRLAAERAAAAAPLAEPAAEPAPMVAPPVEPPPVVPPPVEPPPVVAPPVVPPPVMAPPLPPPLVTPVPAPKARRPSLPRLRLPTLRLPTPRLPSLTLRQPYAAVPRRAPAVPPELPIPRMPPVHLPALPSLRLAAVALRLRFLPAPRPQPASEPRAVAAPLAAAPAPQATIRAEPGLRRRPGRPIALSLPSAQLQTAAIVILPTLGAALLWLLAGAELFQAGAYRQLLLAVMLAGPLASAGALVARAASPPLAGLVVASALLALVLVGRAALG